MIGTGNGPEMNQENSTVDSEFLVSNNSNLQWFSSNCDPQCCLSIIYFWAEGSKAGQLVCPRDYDELAQDERPLFKKLAEPLEDVADLMDHGINPDNYQMSRQDKERQDCEKYSDLEPGPGCVPPLCDTCGLLGHDPVCCSSTSRDT